MLSVLTYSDVGGHANNEDAFAVQCHPLAPAAVVCVVADGQGGRAGGGPAAQLACRAGLEILVKSPPDKLSDQRLWVGLLRTVDEAVRKDESAGFTTFVGMCVTADRVVGVSSGDSAALVVTPTGAAELTRGQQKNPPVGSGMAVAVPFEAELDEPWQLLVMTDGVWKYVGWKRVIEVAQRARGAELLLQLDKAARLPGSGQFPDDFTVVLVEPLNESQHS